MAPADLMSAAACCRRLHALCLSPEVWRRLCKRAWGLSPDDPHIRLRDEVAGDDFVALYSLTEWKTPTQFDCRSLPFRVRQSAGGPGKVPAGDDGDGGTGKGGLALGVEFSGRLGQGNRCIRADHPLPSTLSKERTGLAARRRVSVMGPVALLKRLMGIARGVPLSPPRCAFPDMGYHESLTAQPFCTPLVLPDRSVDVTPRLVSYFEVTIGQPKRRAQNGIPECVAVGLSRDGFNLLQKMPGWDSQSYGYHGDDGGAYHDSGHMCFKFGPKYGPGDTVGCGLDYSQGSGQADLFYTLNGEYKGVAFRGLRGQFFPTVGLDSGAPVKINFGSCSGGVPFLFDLQRFVSARGYHDRVHDALKQAKEEVVWSSPLFRLKHFCLPTGFVDSLHHGKLQSVAGAG